MNARDDEVLLLGAEREEEVGVIVFDAVPDVQFGDAVHSVSTRLLEIG